jgi:hypothetical protein
LAHGFVAGVEVIERKGRLGAAEKQVALISDMPYIFINP